MELKYRPEIDGLRTITVLSVIIYHAEVSLGAQYLLKGGFFGVDVFFVISGFLITSLILSEYLRTGAFSIVNFYERRVRRLLPALLTVMLVSLPFAWKYLLPTQLIDLSKSLIASLLFGSNFYWHNTLQEYAAESSLLKPFLHTWTLAVEEQYYILYPLIFVAIFRWRKSLTIVFLTIGFALSLVFAVWMTAKNASFSFYMLPSRFWELLAGGLLATTLHFHPREDNDVLLNRLMPILGLLLIFYSVFFIKLDPTTHPGFITLIPVIGSLLIIWFANEKDLVTKVLSSKLLVSIGLISYSLYLWHYPIFAFGRVKNSNPTGTDKLVWVILTFLLSTGTYFLIERPFRNRKLISLKTIGLSLISAISVVIFFSFYSIQHDGLKERLVFQNKIYGQNEFDNKILQGASGKILNELAKSHGFGPSYPNTPSTFEAEQLWFSNNANTKKILIIGNSHSRDLFNALYLNRKSFPDMEFARFGTRGPMNFQQIDMLLKSPNFKMCDIVMIAYQYGETVIGVPLLIDAFKAQSKKVLIVLNTVEFKNIENKPIFDWYLEHNYKDFSIDKLKELFFTNRSGREEKYNRYLIEIAKKRGIKVLDKKDFMCNMQARTCDGITNEGYKSFWDYGHWTVEGAEYFGRRIHEINWLKID